jgi:hypothetical protein
MVGQGALGQGLAPARIEAEVEQRREGSLGAGGAAIDRHQPAVSGIARNEERIEQFHVPEELHALDRGDQSTLERGARREVVNPEANELGHQGSIARAGSDIHATSPPGLSLVLDS